MRRDKMRRYMLAVQKGDKILVLVSGLALTFMMVVTLLDVIMRNLGHPVVGSIELISFCGAVIIGFAIPYTCWKKANVYVDLVLEKLGSKGKRMMAVFSRFMGTTLFIFMGVNFIVFGVRLIISGEVTPGLKLPYYPIAFGLSVSSFFVAATLFLDLVGNLKGGDNE
jgi:TRAP-type transport system small permease protein